MGLVLPWEIPIPHYICELCTVRTQLRRELEHTAQDTMLLMLERMRQIDFMSVWKRPTLRQYGGKFLRFV
jgi:hypothetical protein